jgi:hypothetical protein
VEYGIVPARETAAIGDARAPARQQDIVRIESTVVELSGVNQGTL